MFSSSKNPTRTRIWRTCAVWEGGFARSSFFVWACHPLTRRTLPYILRPQGYRVIIFIKRAASLCLWSPQPEKPYNHIRQKERMKDNLLRPIRTYIDIICVCVCVYNRISHAFLILIPSPVSSSASTSKSLTEVERHPRWGCYFEPAAHPEPPESQRLHCKP